ncbi:integrase [Rheinheimera pacifica]|uniref:site-specific integrase n=1 Tax=Rheinheimera pacifica TaxID=173990 RepID=UPI002168A23E|nr:site-specific integrase [Rheinheimera pacifica]MCS4309283.1 integrase [Rheinheimera pacifica]
MAYSVRLIQVESHGDREVIVCDSEGMPPIDINMYITRYRARSYSYRLSLARAITKIYLWADERNIDLQERMKSGEFLGFFEMESFKEYLRYRVNAPTHSPQSIEIAKNSFIGSDTYRRRAVRIINYLEFLGNVFAGTRKSSDPYAKQMKTFITQFGQLLKEHEGLRHTNQRYGLTEEQIAKLLRWVDPQNPQNPFQDRVKLRNQLIVHILLLTGVRDGELLSLRPDALIKKPYGYALRVTQNITLELDPRAYPPNVKTYARDIPVSDKIAQMTDTYIRTERKQRGRASAKAAPYLFLNTELEPKPATIRVVSHICERVRELDPDMFKSLFPHLLRHTFNDLLVLTSELEPDSEEFKNLQRDLCGWTTDSNQGKTYTRRANELLAAQTLQKIESQFML